MHRALPLCCFALSLASIGRRVEAQPWEVWEVPETARVGPVPETPGTGASAQFVRGFFQGHPFSLDDARDMMEGRSIVPIFDVWCGLVPYVNFTNATVPDSLGHRGDPVLCLPFLQADRPDAAADCRPLPGVPNGAYWMNGGAVLRVRGLLAVRLAGTMTLAWGHDDGFSFALAGHTVSEFPGPTGSRVDRAVVRFSAPGLYPFQLDWFDGVGGALLDWYSAPGEHLEDPFSAGTFRLVPRDDLYPDEASPCRADCDPCPSHLSRCDRPAGRCVACLNPNHCPAGSSCTDGRCVAGPADAGAPPTPDAATPADLGPPTAPPAGCTCGIDSAPTTPGRSPTLCAGLLLAMALTHRRRRPHRGKPLGARWP